jgi:hypothetical protein
MHSIIINNAILNEMTSRALTCEHSILKKVAVSLLVIISLLYYGLESLFSNWLKK